MQFFYRKTKKVLKQLGNAFFEEKLTRNNFNFCIWEGFFDADKALKAYLGGV